MEQKVITFYKFAEFPEHAQWKPKLEEIGEREQISGTLILANEGINATLSGSPDGLDQFLASFAKMSDSRTFLSDP